MTSRRFPAYAWAVLIFNIAVILWGAFVRASGSGAGCGSHWPLCNGEIIPQAQIVQTLVEFAHRLTSGVALLMVIALIIWAFRIYPAGHLARRGAVLSTIFIFTEALLGAGLVLFELVAHNPSMMRAFSMAAHLVNTFILLASLTLTIWWSSGGGRIRLAGQGIISWGLIIGITGMLVLGATGAITALGDTLFPAKSLAEGLQQDTSPTAHLLIRLRVFHPIIAVLVGVYLTALVWYIRGILPAVVTTQWAWGFTGLFITQLAAGAINIVLLVPIWMQLVHLLLADTIWILLIWLTAMTLNDTTVEAEVPVQQELVLNSKF